MTRTTDKPTPTPKRRVLRQTFTVTIDIPDDSISSTAAEVMHSLDAVAESLPECTVTVSEAKRARFAMVDAAPASVGGEAE